MDCPLAVVGWWSLVEDRLYAEKRSCWVLITVSVELVCGMTAFSQSRRLEMCNLTIIIIPQLFL